MFRMVLTALCALALASPAAADVTIKQTMTGKGLGMSGNMTGTTYIKGLKMRSDVVTGNRTLTTIFDLDAQKMYTFDSRKKEADVWDMQAFANELATNVETSDMKTTLTPNNQTKTIAGQTATGYDLVVSTKAAMGGNKDMMMTVQLQGPVWIVKGAPGTDDYVGFYTAAIERGWIFTDPRAAKGMPGQAKSMAEMYRQFAETGGIAYETDVEIKMSGGGPMGGLLGRMGGMKSTTTVESIDTSALDDALFAPPAGYKLKPQK